MNNGLDKLNKENYYLLTWLLKALWSTKAKRNEGKGSKGEQNKSQKYNSLSEREKQSKSSRREK